jgi:hypothetical protein
MCRTENSRRDLLRTERNNELGVSVRWDGDCQSNVIPTVSLFAEEHWNEKFLDLSWSEAWSGERGAVV